MKVFISHSSKDSKIAIIFSKFLENINVEIAVFCSSVDGSILAGEDFVKKIDKEIDESDMFIALLSNDYRMSKYCLIELGYAYAKSAHEDINWIMPVYLPDGYSVLDNTPLTNLQRTPINSENHIRGLVKKIEDFGYESNVGNDLIRKFVRNINNEYIRKMDIFSLSQIVECCSDAAKTEAIRCNKSDDCVYMNFNLGSDNKNDWPDFISMVFNFYNELDLYNYYCADNNIKLHFLVENYTDSINRIQIEFQTEFNRLIGSPVITDIGKGITPVDIPISNYSIFNRDLSRLYNICFVLPKDSFVEAEGTIILKELCIR